VKANKFREQQIKKVSIPDHISDEDLSTTINVLIQIGDVRVMAWMIENLDDLKLSDGQIEALCSVRPLSIKTRQNLARRIKTTAAAKKLKAGCSSLKFRIELVKNQHLSDECKKSCLTNGNIKFILNAAEYSYFNLTHLKNEIPVSIWNWLNNEKTVKDIIT